MSSPHHYCPLLEESIYSECVYRLEQLYIVEVVVRFALETTQHSDDNDKDDERYRSYDDDEENKVTDDNYVFFVCFILFQLRLAPRTT